MNTTASWSAAALGRSPAARSLNYQIGRIALRHYRIWAALVLLLAWLNCFWRLSSSVVSDLDEARYGVAASEMMRSHSMLIATYAGRPDYWNLKPPLGYWMQELAFRLLGPTVFAMRLPSALCALALIAITMEVCRRWYGRRQALLTGLLLSTCFGFMSYHGARSGDLDSALSLILLVAAALTPFLERSSKARLLWAAMLSLGFLLKSFAILPFVLVTALYLLWAGDVRRMRWHQWVPSMALFLSVVLGWIVARSHHDGSMYFVNRMFREDLFWRSTRVLDDERARPLGYLAVLLDRFAPWPRFIVAAALFVRRTPGGTDLRSRLLLLWALVPLTAFTLARTKHHWYLDPTYPAWSMLSAIAVLQLIGSTTARLRLATVALVVLCLVLCEVRVLWRIGWTDRRPASQTFLLSLQDHAIIPADELIYATFPLSHSERFLLEVVDGFGVVDSEAPSAPGVLPITARVVLVGRRQLAGLTALTPPGWSVLTRSGDYAILRHTYLQVAPPRLAAAR
jgi:4-amino-4-deoxy-L-arabinose transferase-like glycosyltransferase